MGLFDRRRPPRGTGNPNQSGLEVLTAAGLRVGRQEGDDLRRLIQPWQARAFSYYDQLGEIWYASQFYARMMSLLRLYPAELDANGDWVETTFQPAVDALARIQDPGGGREGLQSSYGRLMFVTGETYLLCSVDPDTELEQWEMLSTDELRVQDGIYTRYKAPSIAAEQLYETPSDDDFEPIGDEAVVYRLWRRHPRYSYLADSPMKGVLDLCEELLLLTRAVRARARSRLAGTGILAISEDFSHTPVEAQGDEDAMVDPFLRDLLDAMLAPISNEGAASQIVPIVVRGSTEAVQNGIRHIQIVDPTQLYPETGLRRECIERIALGLDLPPEVLLGLTDANHWSAWLVDEQTWKAHGQPASNQLVNDLTSSYFCPELRANGVEDWQRYAIKYDASAVVNHPDRSKDAKDLYDRRAIGKRALREANNFDEEDEPTPEELNEMIGVAVRDGSLALFGEPSVKQGGIEPEAGEIVAPTGTVEAPATGSQNGASAEKGPPEGDGSEPPVSVVGSALKAAKIAGAADLAILRCRELAGNRILGLAKRQPEIKDEIEKASVRARDVAAFLGRDRVLAIVKDEAALLAQARSIFEETLTMWGIAGEERDLILTQLERHAIRTLYDVQPAPLPPRFATYVSGVLAKGD